VPFASGASKVESRLVGRDQSRRGAGRLIVFLDEPERNWPGACGSQDLYVRVHCRCLMPDPLDKRTQVRRVGTERQNAASQLLERIGEFRPAIAEVVRRKSRLIRARHRMNVGNRAATAE
jgi:hypothetical protein